jgi:hypothetical protein
VTGPACSGVLCGGAWNNAPPLFLLSFGGAELVPALLWIVILELFNVIFV